MLRAPVRGGVSTQCPWKYVEPAKSCFRNELGKPGEREEGGSLVGKKLKWRIGYDVVPVQSVLQFTCPFHVFSIRYLLSIYKFSVIVHSVPLWTPKCIYYTSSQHFLVLS